MTTDNSHNLYRIWGVDNEAYGPVKLSTMQDWVCDGRIIPQSWVYVETANEWQKADQLPELAVLFSEMSEDGSQSQPAKVISGVTPGALRRIKILADMDETQLTTFLHYVELVNYKEFASVVKAGESGDAMYLILEGELRARVLVEGRETTLATLSIGDFFGEMSLLDKGPRSADVLANQDSLVLRISSAAFQKLMSQAPGLAMRFLYAISRSIAGRIRTLTKKYQDSIHFSRTLEIME